MQRQCTVLLIFIFLIAGCAHAIRIDSETYLRNPAQYQNNHIVIAADLAQVLDNYEAFEGRTIEISALVSHFEERDSTAWYLILEKDGKQLRAYEDSFLKYVPADAVYLARWAKSEGGYVTARGTLLKNRIELDQLTYKTLIVNSSAIPT